MPKAVGRTIIHAPLERVWEVLRDFTSTPKWFGPAVACEMEDGGPTDRVGAVKRVHLADGQIVREKLLALSDYDHSLMYQILMPTEAGSARGAPGAVARIELRKLTGGDATFIEWSHEFEVLEGEASAIEAFFNALYPHFFEALTAYVSSVGGRGPN